MKNIFYYFFLSFLFSSSLFANELDEELIDKKFNQIKTYEDKLDTANYRNTTIRLLDDLEPLTKYIIEHSGLDPKH